jgi:hypothetical protein
MCRAAIRRQRTKRNFGGMPIPRGIMKSDISGCFRTDKNRVKALFLSHISGDVMFYLTGLNQPFHPEHATLLF